MYLGAPVALLIAACDPREPIAPVGLSAASAYPSSVSVAVDAGPPPGPSPLPPDFRATFTKLNRARYPSRGHSHERFWVDVYASDAAKAAFGSSKPMPAGAVVAMDHYERSIGGEKLAGTLAMQKKDDGAWRWLLLDAKGQVTKDGAIEACASCHAQAAFDSVFPVVE